MEKLYLLAGYIFSATQGQCKEKRHPTEKFTRKAAAVYDMAQKPPQASFPLIQNMRNGAKPESLFQGGRWRVSPLRPLHGLPAEESAAEI